MFVFATNWAQRTSVSLSCRFLTNVLFLFLKSITAACLATSEFTFCAHELKCVSFPLINRSCANLIISQATRGLPRCLSSKESACQCRTQGLTPGLGRFPGEGNGKSLVFLPGEFHGQRSLAGSSPLSH